LAYALAFIILGGSLMPTFSSVVSEPDPSIDAAFDQTARSFCSAIGQPVAGIPFEPDTQTYSLKKKLPPDEVRIRSGYTGMQVSSSQVFEYSTSFNTLGDYWWVLDSKDKKSDVRGFGSQKVIDPETDRTVEEHAELRKRHITRGPVLTLGEALSRARRVAALLRPAWKLRLANIDRGGLSHADGQLVDSGCWCIRLSREINGIADMSSGIYIDIGEDTGIVSLATVYGRDTTNCARPAGILPLSSAKAKADAFIKKKGLLNASYLSSGLAIGIFPGDSVDKYGTTSNPATYVFVAAGNYPRRRETSALIWIDAYTGALHLGNVGCEEQESLEMDQCSAIPDDQLLNLLSFNDFRLRSLPSDQRRSLAHNLAVSGIYIDSPLFWSNLKDPYDVWMSPFYLDEPSSLEMLDALDSLRPLLTKEARYEINLILYRHGRHGAAEELLNAGRAGNLLATATLIRNGAFPREIGRFLSKQYSRALSEFLNSDRSKLEEAIVWYSTPEQIKALKGVLAKYPDNITSQCALARLGDASSIDALLKRLAPTLAAMPQHKVIYPDDVQAITTLMVYSPDALPSSVSKEVVARVMYAVGHPDSASKSDVKLACLWLIFLSHTGSRKYVAELSAAVQEGAPRVPAALSKRPSSRAEPNEYWLRLLCIQSALTLSTTAGKDSAASISVYYDPLLITLAGGPEERNRVTEAILRTEASPKAFADLFSSDRLGKMMRALAFPFVYHKLRVGRNQAF
jgi:hypothetical protein